MTMLGDPCAGAHISEDGLYRYSLWRAWGGNVRNRMVFVMLNPSTADASADDPTIRRCIAFAKREHCEGIEVINLYALRATKPIHLRDHPDPEGPENQSVWDVILPYYIGAPVVAAWGGSCPAPIAPSKAYKRADLSTWLCLGRTAEGHPRHPLYLKADTKLEKFTQ